MPIAQIPWLVTVRRARHGDAVRATEDAADFGALSEVHLRARDRPERALAMCFVGEPGKAASNNESGSCSTKNVVTRSFVDQAFRMLP